MSNNILSSYSTPSQVQDLIRDTINISHELSGSGYSAIAENSQVIEFEIRNALQKQGMSIVVMTPKMSLQGNTLSGNVYAIDELQIMICEYVPVNRASTKANFTTALDMGSYLAEYLAGRQSPLGYGALSFRDVEQGEDNGILVVKVNFATYVQGQYGEIVNPLDDYYTKVEVDAKLVALARSLGDAIDQAGSSAVWGNISGDMANQQDLNQRFSDVDAALDSVDGSIEALQRQIDDNTFDISRIDQAITPTAPSTEAEETALAGAKSTAEFVNSSINNFAAYYITYTPYGDAFPTKTSLEDATVVYSGGQPRVPTKNDYCIVLSDGSHPTPLGEPTTRYTWNGQWEFQYVVNNTSMTQAQVNAINSGITAQKVAKIDDATTQEYVDTQISSVLSQTSKCVYLKKNNTIYGNQGFQRDGDYAVDWQDSTPVSVPGRPNVTDVLANISFKRAQASESGQIIAYPVTMRIPDSVWSVKTLGDGKTWYPSTALGTLYSEWSYTDTLSARSMISANVKSPYVQKNQLSNVNVFSGKYEDGSTFEISCLGTM